MVVLLKHCKNSKIILSSGEGLLDLDFKVGIVIRTYRCVEFAILEDSWIFQSFCPSGPLPGIIGHSFSFQELV